MDSKPSPHSRREVTKTQNRELILDAARLVFAQMGYPNATVRDIIRATPLASGTFYNYFKSKEQVYQALRDEEALVLRPRLRQVRKTAKTAEEFIAESFRTFFWFELEKAENRSERFRLDSPEVQAGFEELRQDIQSAMSRGLLPSADVTLVTAALSGMAFELAEEIKRGAEVDRVTRFATTLVLRGMGGLAKG